MAVPLLDLKAQNGALESELQAAFNRVLRSGYYILGGEVEGFEKELAEFCQVRHALAVSSGTDAILLALMALGIEAGDEVICPAFTFFATAGCVARLGARPVFVDSLDRDFNIDPAAVEAAITPRTKAIIPVHLFGQMAQMDQLTEVARRHGLPVIEDAAQAMGATFDGRQTGAFGAFSAFSFFPSKNLGCLGDSGALVTNDDKLAERAKILRVHGMQPKYFHPLIGGNFRIDALQAAFLRVKLPHYNGYSQKRAENAAFYTHSLRDLPGVTEEAGAKDAALILPRALPGRGHIWNQYTLRVPAGDGSARRRDGLRAFLGERGIGCEIYYPKTLHTQECFAGAGQGEVDLARAERMSREVLSIPVYPELVPAQREEVADALRAFVASGG